MTQGEMTEEERAKHTLLQQAELWAMELGTRLPYTRPELVARIMLADYGWIVEELHQAGEKAGAQAEINRARRLHDILHQKPGEAALGLVGSVMEYAGNRALITGTEARESIGELPFESLSYTPGRIHVYHGGADVSTIATRDNGDAGAVDIVEIRPIKDDKLGRAIATPRTITERFGFKLYQHTSEGNLLLPGHPIRVVPRTQDEDLVIFGDDKYQPTDMGQKETAQHAFKLEKL